MELVLADPDPMRFAGTDGFKELELDFDHVEQAIKWQLARLWGGLLSGHLAFRVEAQPMDSNSPERFVGMVSDVLAHLAAILRAARVESEAAPVLVSSYDAWERSLGGAEILHSAPPASRAFLSALRRFMHEQGGGGRRSP